MRTAVVVGAGMAGLATAGALARAGWQVTLLERDERVGRAADRAGALAQRRSGRCEALGLDGGLDGDRRAAARRRGPPPGRAVAGAAAGPAPAPATADAGRRLVVHLEDLHDALVAGLGDQVDIRTGVDGAATVRVGRGAGRRSATAAPRSKPTCWWPPTASTARSAARLAPGGRVVGSGFAAWRAVIPWYRVPRPAGRQAAGGETLGAGYRFVFHAARRARLGAADRAASTGSPPPPARRVRSPPATQLALLRRWFAGWHAPVGAAAGRDRARRSGAAGGARAAAAAPGVRLPLGHRRRGAARRRRPRHAAPPRPGRLPGVRGRGDVALAGRRCHARAGAACGRRGVQPDPPTPHDQRGAADPPDVGGGAGPRPAGVAGPDAAQSRPGQHRGCAADPRIIGHWPRALAGATGTPPE